MKWPSCLYVGFEVGIYISRDKTASTANFCLTQEVSQYAYCVPACVRSSLCMSWRSRGKWWFISIYSQPRHSIEASGLSHSSPLCPWDRPGGIPWRVWVCHTAGLGFLQKINTGNRTPDRLPRSLVTKVTKLSRLHYFSLYVSLK